MAILQLGLGNVDATFEWLARACAEHSIGAIWLAVDPIWDPLRGDARFARIVASMGIDPPEGGGARVKQTSQERPTSPGALLLVPGAARCLGQPPRQEHRTSRRRLQAGNVHAN